MGNVVCTSVESHHTVRHTCTVSRSSCIIYTSELDVAVCFPLTLLPAMRNHCSAI